ncbi:MAG: 4Fe-4S dicluster domain-containing protein [Myxococcales bacterium]|nr:4Fe-4S dicluster domain-containing protein [Myxococcales bacterium]
MITRRALLTLFRAAEPHASARPAEVPPDVAARARAFREAMAARGAADGDVPNRAVIAPRLCLLTLGTECGTCLERCPEPGAITQQGREIVVRAARCTGCGECVSSCPAPIPALALRPVTR